MNTKQAKNNNNNFKAKIIQYNKSPPPKKFKKNIFHHIKKQKDNVQNFTLLQSFNCKVPVLHGPKLEGKNLSFLFQWKERKMTNHLQSKSQIIAYRHCYQHERVLV